MLEANGDGSPTDFLEGTTSPHDIEYKIVDVENIWKLIKDGTQRFNSSLFGFVPIGPALGNLGEEPQISLINSHLDLKIPMKQRGRGAFYNTLPDDKLQSRISDVSQNLLVDGVNVYLVSDEGRERIAYKDSNGAFIYHPSTGLVTDSEELQKHLELAAKIYKAYVTAYYQEEGMDVPGDTLIFDGKYLILHEKSRHSQSGSDGEQLAGIIVSKKPDVNFDDIGGQEKAVGVCRRFAEQLRYPEIYALQGSDPPRGILLHGPPGTGKTLLAKAIANEADAHFLHIDASDIAGQGLYGQSERAIKAVFNLAKDLSARDGKQVIVFVDEGDLLLPKAGQQGGSVHEATGKTISIFAQEMDGLVSSKKLTVVISTNDPNNLDPRILSRMDESEEVPLPTKEGIENILEIHFKGLNQRAGREVFGEDVNVKLLAEAAFAQGLSGRDIADMVGLVARQRGQRQLAAIKKAIDEGKLVITEDQEEREFVNNIATRILNGDTQDLEMLVLPPATTEEIQGIINNAKVLLKNKRKSRLGFDITI